MNKMVKKSEMVSLATGLTRPSRVALTVRSVGGWSPAEIARAFLVPEATMAQRISRAKQRIKAAGASFDLPPPAEQAERPVWTVLGAPSQTVRPAPKRTDDAVRPAPKPGQQGPKAVPRSVPSAVQGTEAEEADVDQDQSPAERRA